MLFGDSSLGISGIAQTPFFLFVISTPGLSQLGITMQDASKLLQAYQNSWQVSVRGSRLTFKFGDVAKLIAGTPHPSKDAGVKSWLEWVINPTGGRAKSVSSRGFVSRSNLKSSAAKNIRLPPPGGGLMLPRGVAGSKGSWQFPPHLQNYDRRWLSRNAVPIRDAIAEKISSLLRAELKRG